MYFSLCAEEFHALLSSGHKGKEGLHFPAPNWDLKYLRLQSMWWFALAFFLLAARLLPLLPGTLQGAAGLSARKLRQLKVHLVHLRSPGQLHWSATGESRRHGASSWTHVLHVPPICRQKCLMQSCLHPQADCNLTLSAHDTFEGFKSALKTFVEKFNVHQLTSKWIQAPSRSDLNFIDLVTHCRS